MSVLDKLAACAGSWRGTSRLLDPSRDLEEESSSKVTVAPILGGRFVRLAYTWIYDGSPQEGILLIGSEADPPVVTAHWIDTWHMADRVMACRGEPGPTGDVDVRGSYAAGSGPDWGWRIAITTGGGAQLRIVMFNIAPDGTEELAVEANYDLHHD